MKWLVMKYAKDHVKEKKIKMHYRVLSMRKDEFDFYRRLEIDEEIHM